MAKKQGDRKPRFIIIMEDPIIHTNERPFCSDVTCPCRVDGDLFYQYVTEPIQQGLLIDSEAFSVYVNEHTVKGEVQRG